MTRILGPKPTLGNIEKHPEPPSADPDAVTRRNYRRSLASAHHFHLASLSNRRICCVNDFLAVAPPERIPNWDFTSLARDFGPELEQLYRYRGLRRAVFLTMMHP